MSKVSMQMPYGNFILDARDAITLGEIISRSERYLRKGYGEDAAHFIWKVVDEDMGSITMISDERYRLAKLAGKPEDK